ncbi:hypothetical protein P7C71_g867, partial [Lecanoromycetidae sp. Uapishka_2]
MKSSTTFLLATLLALSTAAPFEKRDMVTVIDVVEVVETVDVTTTIFVPPGDPRLAAQQAALKPQVPAPAPAQTTSVAVVYSPPQKSAIATSQAPAIAPQVPQKEEAVHAAPVSSSSPAAAPAKAPVIAAAPAVEKVAQPAQQQAATVQQSSSPMPSPSTPSTSTSGTSASGGACGEAGGECIASDVTTFGGSNGSGGSCGPDDLTGYGENYFALAYEMMGTASNIGGVPANPNCGRTAEITYNGKTVTGKLADKCMGCSGASLDLSPTLFASLFDGAVTGRYHGISWKFTNGPGPCTAFQSTTSYDHASTSSWNSSIINQILTALISATSHEGQPPTYKFSVNSTIIQHSSEPSPDDEESVVRTDEGQGGSLKKRGMHSASGAYWNNEKDGMWSFKYDKAESKGFDVVVTIIWIEVP